MFHRTTYDWCRYASSIGTVSELVEVMRGSPVSTNGSDDPEDWTYKPGDHLKCADGFTLSITAGRWAASVPQSNVGPWLRFEVGYPSGYDELLAPYSEGWSIFEYGPVFRRVPEDVVRMVLSSHGGIVGSIPPTYRLRVSYRGLLRSDASDDQ